jgi:predicted MFS family arabinose efflux permease
MARTPRSPGWSVAWTAFTVAVFAWGVGFYGPSVFLQTLHTTRGWPIVVISSAITFQFLLSAAIIVYLPEIHLRFGIAYTTMGGAVLAAAGLLAWSTAAHPWHLFVAAALTGAGWSVTSGAALNAMVAPWFDRDRPKALSLAFNGASVGGIVFVPLWIALISTFGFSVAGGLVGVTMMIVVGTLAARFLRRVPRDIGLNVDGDVVAPSFAKSAPTLTRAALVRDRRFVTISAAFALGLFAQIGLFAHLLARLSPEIGTATAGMAISLATICAVVGRTVMGSWLGDRDRRVVAAANFAVQVLGTLLLSFGSGLAPLALGCVFFGLGVGNLTSLPPLIAQKEFTRVDVGAVVALVTAINQGVFAFAPAIFGMLREATTDYEVPFAVAAILQVCAAAIVLAGRPPRTAQSSA